MSSENKRFGQAMTAAAPAVWDWDVSTNRLIVSPRLREIFGFTKDQEVTLETLRDATTPHDRAWSAMIERNPGGIDGKSDQLFVYQIERADTGERRWIETRVSSAWVPDHPGVAAGYTAVIEDISDRVRADQSLVESEARLRLAVEAGKMAIWEVDLESGSITNTPELNMLFGYPPEAKPTLAELRTRYAPGELERLAKEKATWEIVREQFERGEYEPRSDPRNKNAMDRTQVQAEVAIVVPPGHTKYLLYRAQYSRSMDGRPRITGFLVDITERKAAEKRLSVVVRELHHRLKNSVAVIQAIASQSFRTALDIERGMQVFFGRLNALSAATDIVLDNDMDHVELMDIIQSITKPYRNADSDPFVLQGTALRLSKRFAAAISMILHELSTNALKYGALSVAGGEVRLAWQTTAEGRIVIAWKELGGPQLHQPTRRGYGTTLIETLASGELEGTVDIAYDTQGVICRIVSGPILERS